MSTAKKAQVEEKSAETMQEASQPQHEVKSVITDALYGTVDAKESIEILSELLYPGENLIEMIMNKKIISEITAKVKGFQQKTEIEMLGIEKVDGVFIIKLRFIHVNDFLSEQQKIIAHLTQTAKAYNAKLEAIFSIKHTIN